MRFSCYDSTGMQQITGFIIKHNRISHLFLICHWIVIDLLYWVCLSSLSRRVRASSLTQPAWNKNNLWCSTSMCRDIKWCVTNKTDPRAGSCKWTSWAGCFATNVLFNKSQNGNLSRKSFLSFCWVELKNLDHKKRPIGHVGIIKRHGSFSTLTWPVQRWNHNPTKKWMKFAIWKNSRFLNNNQRFMCKQNLLQKIRNKNLDKGSNTDCFIQECSIGLSCLWAGAYHLGQTL